MLRRSPQRRAFTLIEIIVVATLISLLSGIALFSINEMYIRNIRKVSVADAYQLATALSIAENDLIFFPRLNYLRQPNELVLVDETSVNAFSHTTSSTPEAILPGLDYWGMLSSDTPVKLRVLSKWEGPYMGVSQARQDSNRGGQSGIVKMRLPDLAELSAQGASLNGDPLPSVVDWPADPFGNPYILYQLKAVIDPGAQVNIPLFLENPSDDPSFRNMVVSYGRNNVPGGNENTSLDFRENVLFPGALYVEGDPYNGVAGVPDGPADFTLKIIGTADIAADIETRFPNVGLILENETTSVLGADTTSQHYLILRSLSLEATDPGNFDPDAGQVGVIDDGSDDIILEF